MKRNYWLPLAAMALLCVFVYSCSKHDGNSSAPAHVMLVNASPLDSLAKDFYFNDAKLNATPLAYPQNSAYLSLVSKNYNVKIAETNMINALASGNYSLGSGRSYSVFAYDTLQSGKIKVFATEDDLSAPSSGKAKIRFYHLSPTKIAVDVLLNDSVMFANRSYADAASDGTKGAFMSVNAGSYSIKVRLAGATDAVAPLFTLDNISLSPGKIYTLYARGTVSGTGVNTLGAGIISNN